MLLADMKGMIAELQRETRHPEASLFDNMTQDK
jgi:hypothetical protein